MKILFLVILSIMFAVSNLNFAYADSINIVRSRAMVICSNLNQTTCEMQLGCNWCGTYCAFGTCPPEGVAIYGGGSTSIGVPIQLFISNITIQSITSSSMNISSIITNEGYTNPTLVNITQRLLKTSEIISPIETEIYSNSSTISLNRAQKINSTYSWLGILPEGLYRIEITAVSVSDPRVTSVASLPFDYKNGTVTSGNETIYSFAPIPTIFDILNSPAAKPIVYLFGIGTIGLFSVALVEEWVFKKRRKKQSVPTPTQ